MGLPQMTILSRIRAALAVLFHMENTMDPNNPSTAPVPGQTAAPATTDPAPDVTASQESTAPASDPSTPAAAASRTLADVDADIRAKQAQLAAIRDRKAALAVDERAGCEDLGALVAEGRSIMAQPEAGYAAVEKLVAETVHASETLIGKIEQDVKDAV